MASSTDLELYDQGWRDAMDDVDYFGVRPTELEAYGTDDVQYYGVCLTELEAYAMDGTDDTEAESEDTDYLQDPTTALVDDLVFALVAIDAPEWYINPDFKMLFTERESYDSVAECSPLTFAPHLLEVLSSPTPPPLAYFTTLPAPSGKEWGVYAIIMEKEGSQSGLYIGSGTDSNDGVVVRLANYYPGSTALPRFVKQAFSEGYHVAHKGLLCWSDLPTPGLVPRVRARFLALEALFTVLFNAAFAAITDSYYSHLAL